jgi:hypothetical protein
MKKPLAAVVAAGLAAGAMFSAIDVGLDLGSAAYADALTTGSIRGIVKDKTTGESSVGATVVATSPALQGEQVVIADETGGYYITNLPPGMYTLTVYYNNITYSRGNVLIQVGKEVVVNLSVDTSAAKGETIAITGAVPIVDQGSTKVGTTITSDFTNNVPSRRTFGEVMGGAAGAQSDHYGVSFAGATSAENTYVVEGLNTTDTGFGTLSTNLPTEFIQETEVITGGYNAEYGRALGAIVNVVTKSGSNEFHGSVFGHLQTSRLTADARTILREGNAIDHATNQNSRYDFGAELGGPIIPDKLWFHVGFTPTIINDTTTRFISSQVDKVDNTTGMPVMGGDGIPDIDRTTGFTVRERLATRDIPTSFKTYFFTGKLTGAISRDHQWQLAVFGNPENDSALPLNPDGTINVVRDPNTALLKVDRGAYDFSGKWTSKFNDGKTQFDAVAGFHRGYNNASPGTAGGTAVAIQSKYSQSLYDFVDAENSGRSNINGCHDAGDPAATPGPDDMYPRISNCPVVGYIDAGAGFLEKRTNDRISAVLAVTQRVKALGQHVFKAGIDAEFSTYDSGRGFSGGAFVLRDRANETQEDGTPLYGEFTTTQFIKYDPNGTIPCGINGSARCSVINQINADTSDRSLAAYIQDSWEILPNLTLNAGVRWEQQVGYVAGFLQNTTAPDTGEKIPEVGFQLDNLIAPRVGFIYDPTQEGKAKLFGHWGRFYENIPMDMNVRSFGGETSINNIVGVNSSGDRDNSCMFDRSPNFVANVLMCRPGQTQYLGGGITYVAPGLQGQYTEEVILGGEYEIIPDITVGANYIHRTLPRVIEDMSTDGGNSYFIANPSENYDSQAADLDRLAMTTPDMNLKALYRSRAAQLRAVKNYDPPSRTYDALQLVVKKRPTGSSLLQATYTYSRAKGNYPGLFSTETNQLDPNITSQYDLPNLMPNRYGPSGLDRPHSVKVDGFYTFNLQRAGVLVTGVSLRGQSGVPANALAAHPIYGLNESYLLPRGVLYRSPFTTEIDTHISYGYQLSRTTRLEGFIDIFNLLNTQDELSVDSTYTTQVALPVVGGDRNDLLHAKATTDEGRQTNTVITKNLNYGKLNARQTPLTGQLGFRLTF